jgi:hypothetical protein
VQQSDTKSGDFTETGDRITGLTTRTETTTDTYSLTETDKPHQVQESGTTTLTRVETDDGRTAESSVEITGSDQYTLQEFKGKGNTLVQTITGTDQVSQSENTNLVVGTFESTTTVTGSASVAPGNSKKGKTQTINGTQTETGNETIGTIDRVFTGQDRYSLLKSFNFAADNGSNGPGLVDFSLYGAAYVVRETGGEPGASATGAGGSGVATPWPSSDEDLATRVAQSLKLASPQARYLQDGGLTQTQTGDERSAAASQEGYAQLGQDLYMQACFAAGTPIVMCNGWKLIEQIIKGDRVLSRSDLEPDGPLEVKVVEEVFERTAPIAHLHARGQVIRTTRLHRFYLEAKGWTPYSELKVGDRIRLRTDWVVVEDLCDSGETEKVYNLRVADFHTYFVGGEDWGFAVWAHNTYNTGQPQEGIYRSPRELVADTGQALEAGLKGIQEGPNQPGPAQVTAFPTLPGGTGATYDEENGHGIYVLRNQLGQIEYVGRGDAPQRLLAHATPGSGNEDLEGQILWENNLPIDVAESIELELKNMLGGAKSINPSTPLRNKIQAIGETSNPRFTELEFAADTEIMIETLHLAGLLPR